jgi:hypothetical protein
MAAIPSYNGYHLITVLDPDTFTIPVFFVDDATNRGVWVILNETNRYAAVTAVEAPVTLTLRASAQEDHFIYDASVSAFLQGLAVGEVHTDRFYYAVEDSHGAIGIGAVDVRVEGVNNTPTPLADPDPLDQLDPLVGSNTLAQVLASGLDLLYTLPPSSGGTGLVNLQVRDLSGALPGTVVLADFFTTDEDTALPIPAAAVLANDYRCGPHRRAAGDRGRGPEPGRRDRHPRRDHADLQPHRGHQPAGPGPRGAAGGHLPRRDQRWPARWRGDRAGGRAGRGRQRHADRQPGLPHHPRGRGAGVRSAHQRRGDRPQPAGAGRPAAHRGRHQLAQPGPGRCRHGRLERDPRRNGVCAAEPAGRLAVLHQRLLLHHHRQQRPVRRGRRVPHARRHGQPDAQCAGQRPRLHGWHRHADHRRRGAHAARRPGDHQHQRPVPDLRAAAGFRGR